MSVVTLKRKTETQYNNMSVGQKHFSLNGGFRNQGYVGQTMLSRSLPRTPMKGNVPKGHGGCCGTYPNKGIVQSAVKSLNDSTVMKMSSMNTMEMINMKYRWVRRPQPFSVFKIKPPESSTQLKTITQKTMACDDPNYKPTIPKNCNISAKNPQMYPKFQFTTKNECKTVSQSTHIENMHTGCNHLGVIMNTTNGECISKLRKIV